MKLLRFPRTAILIALAAAPACGGNEAAHPPPDLPAGEEIVGEVADEVTSKAFAGMDVPFDQPGPAEAAVADFDRDGTLDVVVLPYDGPARVALQRPGPKLELQAAALPGMTRTGRAVARDFDGDGDSDLLVGCAPCTAGEGPTLFENRWAQTGRVEWTAQRANVGLPPLSDAAIPVAFDMDADGDLDVLVIPRSGGLATLLENVGSPTGLPKWADATWRLKVAPLGAVSGAAVIDVRGDGRQDVYIARPGSDVLLVSEWDGGVRDESATFLDANAGDETSAVAVDTNRDDQLDVVLVDKTGVVSVVRADPARWDHLKRETVVKLGYAASGVAALEFSGDGRADLLVGSAATGKPNRSFGSTGAASPLTKPAFAAAGDLPYPAAPAGIPVAATRRPGASAIAIPAGAAGGRTRFWVTKTTDADCDGMLDASEVALGLDPKNPLDARLDPDGDQVASRDELRFGGNPKSGDSDADGWTDAPDLLADRDLDGDGIPEAWDACPRHTNTLWRDFDGDAVPDECDATLQNAGPLALVSYAVTYTPFLDEHAVQPAHEYDLERATGDRKGRLPTGETFRILSTAGRIGGDADVRGLNVDTIEIVEMYNRESGDHAWSRAWDTWELEHYGYQPLGTVGWVLGGPVPELGEMRPLRRFATFHSVPMAGMVREETVTTDDALATDLVTRGWSELPPLGFVLPDEGKLRAPIPVVRLHQSTNAARVLHSSAPSSERDLSPYVPEGVAFRVFPAKSGATLPLTRLRGVNGEEALSTNPAEHPAWRAKGYVPEAVIGHVLRSPDADPRYDAMPLVRLQLGTTIVHTSDPVKIRTLAAKKYAMTLLGWVVPQPAPRAATCPDDGKHTALATKLRAEPDAVTRSVTAAMGLSIACTFRRVLDGKIVTDEEKEVSKIFASTDPHTRSIIAERTAPWLALTTVERKELLGALDALDPGDCSSAVDVGELETLMELSIKPVPDHAPSLRERSCTGVVLENGGAVAGPKARDVVVPGEKRIGELTYDTLLDPVMLGVVQTDDVRGHKKLTDYKDAHVNVGLPTNGIPTGIPCSATNACNASEGEMCIGGICRAFPIVTSSAGSPPTFTGYNLWDVDPQVVFVPVCNFDGACQPHEDPSICSDCAGVTMTCDRDGFCEPGEDVGRCVDCRGEALEDAFVSSNEDRVDQFTPPQPALRCHPEPVGSSSAKTEEAFMSSVQPMKADLQPGNFYEVRIRNHNGHYLPHAEKVSKDTVAREAAGRTIHVCVPGGTRRCDSSKIAPTCEQQSSNGPACGGTNGGIWTAEPRSLAECQGLVETERRGCAETPLNFDSDRGHYIFVEKAPPVRELNVGLLGGICHDETGPDWPGDDEFVAVLFNVAPSPQTPLAAHATVDAAGWSFDFDSGERMRQAGTRLRTQLLMHTNEHFFGMLQLAEDDDWSTELAVGFVVTLAGAAVVPAKLLVVAGGALVAYGSFAAVLGEFAKPDDEIGVFAWRATPKDVEDLGNLTHDPVSLPFDWTNAPAAPEELVGGPLGRGNLPAIVSNHPSVDIFGYEHNDGLRSCAFGCGGGETCEPGGNVCVPGFWKDDTRPLRPGPGGHVGFVESVRFAPGASYWDYEMYLTHWVDREP